MEVLYEDDIVTEVRRHREELIDDYGGWEGYMKHIYEEQARDEREGRRFKTPADKLSPETQQTAPVMDSRKD